MIFNDIGHNVFHVYAGSTCLLWDETGSSHSGCSIDFKQIDFFSFCDDIVDTYNAFTPQDVVNGRSELLYTVSQFRTDACRSNFCYLSVVFCIKIEELILAYYFCNGKDNLFVFCFVTSVCQFNAVHKCFYHRIVRFGESSLKSRLDLFFCLYFGYTEAGPAGIGFDKTR